MEDIDRTLLRNGIVQFIIRIDLDSTSIVDFTFLFNQLRPKYEKSVCEASTNFNLDIPNGSVQTRLYDKYHLYSNDGVHIEIDQMIKTIIFTASKYINKNVYESRMTEIIDILTNSCQNINAKRIGMRFINMFPCKSSSEISKVLLDQDARFIKSTLQKNNISRSLAVLEYNEDTYCKRVQYGLPNKFYPSIIARCDVMIDIDIYTSFLQGINEWNGILDKFNHAAYDTFISCIKPTFKETLK